MADMTRPLATRAKPAQFGKCVAPRRALPALALPALALTVACLAACGIAWGAAKPEAKAAKPETKTDDSQPKSESTKPTPRKGATKATSSSVAQVDFINKQIHLGWEAQHYVASPACSDNEWCRRLFLDVLGRVPTVDELTRFLADKGGDRKLQQVNRLLGEDYAEEYARNWTTLWTNTLIGRAGGTERNSPVSREGLQQALRRAFKSNMPYDKMVFELVSAKGVNRPGEDGYNGFVNFVVGNLEENAVQATAKTSQVFLGLQVQCTQCHNHPFNDWKQNQFWEMNAFFRQTKAEKKVQGSRDMMTMEVRNENFMGEDASNPQEAVIFYEQRNGYTKAAFPVFVDGTKLKSDSGYVSEIDRRTELAKLIVDSDYMPKAIINRMWAHFLGYGFTKPIDDMGPHNGPTNPELLEGLGKEFRAGGCNVKDLIRWITLSEPYSLSAKVGDRNKKDDPSMGERPAFSHFYLRQMRAEELYESLLVATEAHKTRGTYEEQEASKREWLGQFTIAFGTDENDETTTFNGTIPQTLMMMNGDLIKKATSIEKGSFLQRVAGDQKMNNSAKITYLYMAGLARRPSNAETAKANDLMLSRKGDAVAALQDVWWAVLNSNEFILNH